jgi:diguanylate cyclase (GGDEF)-like protein
VVESVFKQSQSNLDTNPIIGRDTFTGVIIAGALLLFVWTGSTALPTAYQQLTGHGNPNDHVFTANFLLNIALIFIGWRRWKDVRDDRTRFAAAEERSRQLSFKDPLTNLDNRRSLTENGAELLSRSLRREKAVAMIVLNLDHFKNINDVHGHTIGDALLCAVSAELSRLTPPTALTARLGGDEFACAIVFDASDPDIVTQIAEKIVSRLSQPFDANGIHTHISCSVGIAQTASDCDTIDALMRRADIAMYSAKNQGRNRFCWFDASMETALKERNDVELGLRRGIPRGEFVPFFEPQIDLTTGRLIGFEMLARWNHPTGALISPDEFINIAEETGMIADLSMSLMRQAFEEAKNWDPAITLSVNISPVQLRDPWLAQKIVKLLIETGYPANRLEVEITESSLFENLSLAQSIIGSLKNQGIKLALDDFGTGYSSLAHLRALPFDRIKIDKSFVLSILTSSDSAAIVNAITRLGDSLNLPVTAEGIEDADIDARLRQLGCQKGQGWFHGKPMSIAKTRGLLAQHNLLPSARSTPDVAPAVTVAPVPPVAPVALIDTPQRLAS